MHTVFDGAEGMLDYALSPLDLFRLSPHTFIHVIQDTLIYPPPYAAAVNHVL